NMEGKTAKITNGIARAMENPNIPIAGPNLSPFDAASTSSVPMIGPVQENDTKAKLKAIKNRPIKPFPSDFASILLTKELGSVISNAPKKDAAKATKIKKKAKLKTPLVERALSASEPKVIVISIPNATYIMIMNKPYNSAWDIPLLLDPPFLVKKLTVSGTIGNIQGIKNAAKPPSNPAKKIAHSVCLPLLGEVISMVAGTLISFSAARASSEPSVNSRSSGTVSN